MDIMLSHLKFKAILWGFLSAGLLTLSLTARLMWVFTGKSKPDKNDFASLYTNNAFLTALVVVCTITSILAGYVAGYIAHEFPIVNAVATGVFGLLFNLACWGCAKKFPLWYKLTVVTIIPLTYLGGLLADIHF